MAKRPARSVTPRTRSAKPATAPTADQLAGREGRAGLDVPPPGSRTRTGFDAPVGDPYGHSDPNYRQGGQVTNPAEAAYGISGLSRYGAISRVYEEFLRELQGQQGMKYYREMADNDPIIGAILFAANHLCRKVSFSFKPADDSNKAKEIADFMGSAIFDDMESSWPDTLSEILTMLPFGWSVLEWRTKRRLGMEDPDHSPLDNFGLTPPFENRSVTGTGTIPSTFSPSKFDDGKIGFRSWGLRSQETLFMWEFDTDSKATVLQQMAPPDYRIRRIPLSKALHFRTQVAKNNPEGRSVLRNSFTSYYMIKNLQIFEGIGIERDLAGYPVMQMKDPDVQKGMMPPDIWNTKDEKMVQLLSALQRIVRSIRRDEQEGLVLPWWVDFKLVGTGSRRRMETNEIIGRYGQRIAMSMMADFIMLGHEAVGSKALAATKISLFTAALSSFLDNAGAEIDRVAVPTLMRFNGFPLDLAPTFQHGDVENVNLEELGDFIQKIAGTGFNPLATVAAQKAIMDMAKLPNEDVGEEMPQTVQVAVPGVPGAPGATPPTPKGNKAPDSGGRVGDNKSGQSSRKPPVDAVVTEGSQPAQQIIR